MSPKAGNIFLTGFMASGKTTVGRALAARLGCSFVDSDALIERLSGRRLAGLIAEQGEAGFRRPEQRALVLAVRARGKVIAIGGGAVLREANRALMRRTGIVCYLEASTRALLGRLKDRGLSNRPLCIGRTQHERLKSAEFLLRIRRPLYRGVADFTVRCDRGTSKAVARRIAQRLARLGRR